jgi:hypothetical protein
LECLLNVLNEILCTLDADGESYEVARNDAVRTLHGCSMLNEAFDPT